MFVVTPEREPLARALFLSTFLIATCGLIYELVAGALASYLLGDSITWFSLVIGAYLSAMGLGSYLSRYIDGPLLVRFVEIELLVALVGGFEAPLLFFGFAWTAAFRFVLLFLVFLIGVGVGLELPLLIRILERHTTLKELVARVLFLDYIGALAASLAFPLLLLPFLGLFRTSLFFGAVNAGVALWTTFVFETGPATRLRLRLMATAVLVLLGGAFALSGSLEKKLDMMLYADEVVFSTRSPYQQIVLTHADGDTRLFLNGALQFSSVDEYRYHEALVHPPMALAARPEQVLVLGGGDGLAVREVLRHPEVQTVTLVDLDPEMTSLFRDRPELSRLNAASLQDPRVTVINDDAFRWLGTATQQWDVIVVDFPDPNNYALGKLYTTHFYHLLRQHLAPDGAVAIQSTSPFFSPRAFWCISRTLEQAGFLVRPYHAYIPSFGEWGFNLATIQPRGDFAPLPEGLRFLNAATLTTLFHFPPDMQVQDVPINRLDNQELVRIYEEDWRSMMR